MRKSLIVCGFMLMVSIGHAVPPDRNQVQSMPSDEAVRILTQGPGNWFSWCSVVENGTGTLLTNADFKEEAIRLLDKIATSRDEAIKNASTGNGLKHWTGECNDECGECLGRLQQLVAGWHDDRTLKSLVVLGSLHALDFGDAAFPMILERYNKGHSYGRSEMIMLMGEMAKKNAGTAESIGKAKSLVFAALEDGDSHVQMAAIHNLYHFGKVEALTKLKELATVNQRSFIRKKDGVRVFPIREAARKEADRLSNSK
jgi:hypothetical protein